MKTTFSSVKHSYLSKIGILLIVIALVTGIVSCNGVATYALTMAVNPAEGGTATDETGGSPYAENKVVDIKAVAAPCHRFVNWEAPVGIFGNATAAETTFIMPAQDVIVTANFEPVPPDHFKFYEVYWDTAPYIGEEVQLVDQFGTFNTTVGEAYSFGNPVEKIHNDDVTPIADENRHYTIYHLEYEEGWEPSSWQVTVKNQFGLNQELTVEGPFFLAVPTHKLEPGHEMSDCLDHLLVYEISLSAEPEPIGEVDLYDQFHDELGVTVYEPVLFANPVQKTRVDTGEVTEIEKDDEHYVFYPIDGESFNTSIQIDNQFGNQTLNIFDPELLAVPSEKISWEQPLNHFKTYWVDEMPPIGEVVQLEDQFVTINATVKDPFLFANPVEKQAGVEFSELSPIWDPRDHLMFYGIDILEGEDGEWQVVVDNQFGIGQWLRVAGPIMVIVPTEKFPHGPADDLNHFLVYEVIDDDYDYVEVEVYLEDQFTPEGPEFNLVGPPMLFAVPVYKTVPGSDPTPIIGDEHLLFYWIDGGLGFWEPIVYNQFFGPGPIPVYQGDGDWFPPFDLLGVPSETPNKADALAVAAVLGDCDSQLTTLLMANNIWAEKRDWDVISDIGDYDVVVINTPVDPGEPTFLDFLDAASGNQTGVIFTSSYWVGAPWGISLLEKYLDDPDGQGNSDSMGDVYYNVTQEHPIFDGWNVDDEITIITGGEYNDHAWFSDYSGDTIADVGSDSGGIQGDAVAVDTYGGSTHVLLASLGPQGDTDMTDWTDDAKTIFINAVLYAI